MMSSVAAAARAVLLGAIVLLSNCAPQKPPPSMAVHEPVADEVVAAARSGLAATYWHVLVRSIAELESWIRSRAGTPGAPVTALDHVMGDGDVLTSGARDGVGAELAGFIRLAQPGRYRFQANANDGIRVQIAGITVTEDPTVHADRLSPPGTFDVTKPGWYPVRILYFERRNTATLQLFWLPPGQDRQTLLPADVLRHSP